MRMELIRDLLLHLDSDGSLNVDYCSEQEKRRLEKLPLPLDVKRLLQWYWINGGGKVGGYDRSVTAYKHQGRSSANSNRI